MRAFKGDGDHHRREGNITYRVNVTTVNNVSGADGTAFAISIVVTITAGELPLLLLEVQHKTSIMQQYIRNVANIIASLWSLAERLHDYFIGRRLKKIIISYCGY